ARRRPACPSPVAVAGSASVARHRSRRGSETRGRPRRRSHPASPHTLPQTTARSQRAMTYDLEIVSREVDPGETTRLDSLAEPATAASESPTFDPPRDRFEHRGELGRGGMGRVIVARDRALEREVAMKQMLGAGAADFARFEREVRVTARLEHPSIVPIYDAGRTPDGAPYYVMRRIDGRPLEQLVT